MTDRPADRLTIDSLIALNRSATLARLLAGCAHEVNNALQIIRGSVELLEGEEGIPPPATRALERIYGQQSRAAHVMQEVLAFSRRKPGTGPVGLREIASRCTALRAYSAARAGLTLTLDAPGEDGFRIQGDASQLEQALLNLIANAELALAGQRGGTIRVELRTEPSWVTLRVVDSGPGVPADLRERIFDPFVTTRPPLEGSGLGLTVARAIAEAHGGTLILEDTPAGASFLLRLPAGA